MSSLLAGFDMVLEMKREALLALVMRNVTLGDQPLQPPFELAIPLSDGGIKGDAHLIVTDVDLALPADKAVELVFTFQRSSVVLTAPVQNTLSGLEGEITVQAPLQLFAVGTNLWTERLGVNLAAAAVKLSADRIPGPFLEGARSAVEGYIRKLGLRTFPPDLSFVSRALAGLQPTGNGSLTPLRFVRLEPHRIDSETLGLFAILLAANEAKGDARLKTESAIVAGQDACVSISPEALHAFLFCPAVVKALKKTDSTALPRSCGAVEGMSYRGVTLTQVADTLGEGHIAVDVGATYSKSCATVTASTRARIVLTVENEKLVPSLSLDKPNFEVDMSIWCKIALSLTGPLGFVMIELAEEMAADIAASLASQLFSRIGSPELGGNLGSVFGHGFTAEAIAVAPDGLTLQGTLPGYFPEPSWLRVDLEGSVTTDTSIVMEQGTYKARFPCRRTGGTQHGEFPYTVLRQEQTGTFAAVPTLLARPLQLEWWLETGYGGSRRVPLADLEGVAEIPVTLNFPLTLPTGVPVDGVASVRYRRRGETIQLRNNPDQGNYRISLHVRATEPDGGVYEASTMVLFEGNTIRIEGGYQEAVTFCMLPPLTIPRRELKWPPIEHPPVRGLFDFSIALLGSGDPGADTVLAHARLAHGLSFHRAVESAATLHTVGTGALLAPLVDRVYAERRAPVVEGIESLFGRRG